MESQKPLKGSASVRRRQAETLPDDAVERHTRSTTQQRRRQETAESLRAARAGGRQGRRSEEGDDGQLQHACEEREGNDTERSTE